MYAESRGLGAVSDLPTMWPFGTVDCSNPVIWGAFIAKCSEYSPEAWGQIKGFANPFVQPPAPRSVAAGYSPLPAPVSPEEAQAQIDAVLGRQVQQFQADERAAVASGSTLIPDSDSTAPGGLGWKLWLALGLVGAAAVAAVGSGSPRRYGR